MFKRNKTTFLLLSALLLPSLLTASERRTTARAFNGDVIDALPNQVLVRYRSSHRTGAKNTALKRLGGDVRKSLDGINVELLSLPTGETIDSFVEKLKSNPDVEYAEPNGVYHAFSAPNDPVFSSQYYLSTQTTVGSINIVPAWDITTGSGVVVAVLDTGVTLTQPDLASRLWDNPSPSGNSGAHGTTIKIDWNGDGDCLDTNVDDGPEQCASADPTDDDSPIYHGTHVAGIIAAEANNGTLMAGIAAGAKIMAVKVLNSEGAGSFEAISEGVIYAVDHGASVINMSLGGAANSATMQSAIDYATSHNVVVVAAAGNDGNGVPANYPAAISNVIAVGATNSLDQLANFSNTGTNVDLVAPGVSIISLSPSSTTVLSGTSFSSPMVAAVAALIKAVAPTMTVNEVTKYIDFFADDLSGSGFNSSFGFGRLNAYRSVNAAYLRTPVISNPANAGETFPYPNPFNPTTESVTISIPSHMGSNKLQIKIMNIAGERIRTLSDTNVWDGKNDSGDTVASGLYYYFAETSAGNIKGKVTVLK